MCRSIIVSSLPTLALIYTLIIFFLVVINTLNLTIRFANVYFLLLHYERMRIGYRTVKSDLKKNEKNATNEKSYPTFLNFFQKLCPICNIFYFVSYSSPQFPQSCFINAQVCKWLSESLNGLANSFYNVFELWFAPSLAIPSQSDVLVSTFLSRVRDARCICDTIATLTR